MAARRVGQKGACPFCFSITPMCMRAPVFDFHAGVSACVHARTHGARVRAALGEQGLHGKTSF